MFFAHVMHALLWGHFAVCNHEYAHAYTTVSSVICENLFLPEIDDIKMTCLFHQKKYSELVDFIGVAAATDAYKGRICAQAYAKLQRFDEAEKHYARLYSSYPHDKQVIYAYATFLTQRKEYDRAHKVIQDYLADDDVTTADSTLYFLQAYLYQLEDKTSYATKSVARALELQETLEPAWLLKAVLAHQKKDYAQAARSYHEYTLLVGDESRSDELLVNMIKQSVIAHPEDEQMLSCIHGLIICSSHHAQLYTTLKHLGLLYPDNMLLTLYILDIALRKKEVEVIRYYLNRCVERLKNDPLCAHLVYQAAIVYYELRDLQGLEQCAQFIKKSKASYPPLLNVIAYYYCTQGRHMQRARAYIQQALILDEQNPHYKDTLALWYIKNNQYKKAYGLLAPLIAYFPDDAHMQEHYLLARKFL